MNAEMSTSPLTAYARHQLVAWIGCGLVGMALGVFFANSPIGFLFDERGAPYFWEPIGVGLVLVGVGLVLGWLFNRRERTVLAALAFLLPAALFFLDMRSELPYGGWHAFWQANFTSDCSASECLGEALFTMPLYAGIAYSIGSLLALLPIRQGFKNTHPGKVDAS